MRYDAQIVKDSTLLLPNIMLPIYIVTTPTVWPIVLWFYLASSLVNACFVLLCCAGDIYMSTVKDATSAVISAIIFTVGWSLGDTLTSRLLCFCFCIDMLVIDLILMGLAYGDMYNIYSHKLKRHIQYVSIV